MPTRRATVLALGGLLTTGGAVLGTSAFDTVEAERSVSLETAPDSNALLGFEILDEDHVRQTDGTIGFDLVARSKTTFAELVNVRNNGTQTVTSLRFKFSVSGAEQSDQKIEEALQIVSGDATIDAINDADPRKNANLLGESSAGGADDDELSPGEAIPFGIKVDLTDDIHEITGDPEITLTIIADTGEQDSGDGDNDGGDGPAPNPPDVSLVSDSVLIFGSRPRNLEFDVTNDGAPVDISSFTIDMDSPGEGEGSGSGSVPEEFDSFDINFDPGSRTGSDGYQLDSVVGHGSYTLGTEETATYTVEGFDATLNNNEMTLTLASDDETELEETLTLTPPPGN